MDYKERYEQWLSDSYFDDAVKAFEDFDKNAGNMLKVVIDFT